jgi:hypothetical protein
MVAYKLPGIEVGKAGELIANIGGRIGPGLAVVIDGGHVPVEPSSRLCSPCTSQLNDHTCRTWGVRGCRHQTSDLNDRTCMNCGGVRRGLRELHVTHSIAFAAAGAGLVVERVQVAPSTELRHIEGIRADGQHTPRDNELGSKAEVHDIQDYVVHPGNLLRAFLCSFRYTMCAALRIVPM